MHKAKSKSNLDGDGVGKKKQAQTTRQKLGKNQGNDLHIKSSK